MHSSQERVMDIIKKIGNPKSTPEELVAAREIVLVSLTDFFKEIYLEPPYEFRRNAYIKRIYSASMKAGNENIIVFQEEIDYPGEGYFQRESKVVAQIHYNIKYLYFDVYEGYSEDLIEVMNGFFGKHIKNIKAIQEKKRIYSDNDKE